MDNKKAWSGSGCAATWLGRARLLPLAVLVALPLAGLPNEAVLAQESLMQEAGTPRAARREAPLQAAGVEPRAQENGKADTGVQQAGTQREGAAPSTSSASPSPGKLEPLVGLQFPPPALVRTPSEVAVKVVPAGSRQEGAVVAALAEVLREGSPPRSLEEVDAWSQALIAALRAGGFPIGQVLMTAADWESAQRTGMALFSVFPGRVSGIRLENRSRVKDAQLERLITQALCGRSRLEATNEGPLDACLFETRRFERTTQLLQDLPGVALAGAPRFGPGTVPGDVEVSFAITPKGKPWSLDAAADNNGMEATGRTRFTASARGNNMFGLGEDYAASATVTTEGMWTGSLTGSVPILSDGLRLAGGFTRQQYTVNAVGTRVAGTANIVSAGATYPIARGLDFNLWGGASYLHSETKVEFTDFDFATHGQIDGLKLSLSGNSGDRAQQLRTSLWSASAALTLGRQDNDDPLDIGPRRAGTYAKLAASGFGRLTLDKPGDLFATLGVSGQLASRNLDPSEQLMLGGPGAVRSYRADEGTADEGVILNLGLYKRVAVAKGHQLQLGPIADFAYARVNADPWLNWEQSYLGIPDVSNTRKLAAYGLEVAWLTPFGVTLSLAAAKPFGFSDVSWVDPGDRSVQTWFSLSWSR